MCNDIATALSQKNIHELELLNKYLKKLEGCRCYIINHSDRFVFNKPQFTSKIIDNS